MTFGPRMRELRREKHMTQEELGKIIGVTKASVSGYENETRQPDQASLTKLADFFGVSLDYLLGRKDEGNQPTIIVADDFVKVYGEIHAGEAAWAEEDIIGSVPVSKETIARYGRNNLFALRVKGDSMNRKIPNGFVAVFTCDSEPQNGDIVAVMIDHEDATVKVYENTSAAVLFSPDSYDTSFKAYRFSKNAPQDFKILGTYLFSTDQNI